MKRISINFNLLIISVILKLTNVVCCFLTVKRTVYNIHQHSMLVLYVYKFEVLLTGSEEFFAYLCWSMIMQ